LNPLRARLVKDLKALDRYPWGGHSAILGHRNNPLIPDQTKNQEPPAKSPSGKKEKSLAEKTIEDVLLHFGETVKAARRRYREFVKKGIGQGRRPELQGGGLVRSAGGEKAGLLGRNKEGREKGDARILGTGDFVDATLHQSEKFLERKYRPKKTIDDLINVVAEEVGVSPELICSGNRQRKLCEARARVAYLAVEEAGHSAAEVGRHLGIRRVNVLRLAKRGLERGNMCGGQRPA